MCYLEVGEEHLADDALYLLELADEMPECVDSVQVDREDLAGGRDQVERAGEVRAGQELLDRRLGLVQGRHQGQLLVAPFQVFQSSFELAEFQGRL